MSCKEAPQPIADGRKADYAFYDAHGEFHRFSRYNDSKAIVLYVQGNGCPIVRNGLTDFHEVVAEFKDDFAFFMLNANLQDSRESVRKEAEDFNFQVPVLLDSNQLFADALDINTTAEAIILHPTTREVLYRGPVNNRLDFEGQKSAPTESYLRDALTTLLQGQTIAKTFEVTKGCKVTRLSKTQKEDSLTYTQDIAPILQNHCVRCHKDGGIAPWQMKDYPTIVGWSEMIKEVLWSKRMPPWKADPTIGEFTNSFSLPDSQARKVVRWIETGMKQGPGEDPLATIPTDTLVWPMGTPDDIVTLKKESIPATGVIPYRYQKFTLNVDRDVWISGIAMKPGNPKVVHHFVIAETDGNKESLIVNRPPTPWIDNYIAVGTGGDETTIFPDSTGVFLKKGSSLSIQIHYTTTGKPEVDETQIGFYFHETPPANPLYAIAPYNHTFTIPPYSKDTKVVARDTITKDITLHYLGPHMHYRGKSIKIMAAFPSGEIQTLVSVPDYNFNWQLIYKLKEPISLPKNTVLVVEGVYDNSYQNPLNPDPSQELHYGIQSIDEMLIGFMNYTIDK
ncbi:redoxin domain-containing protein [Aureisphaera galaxeae]|uniref:redoxin domain-containing protein n=1 Tax=Aureisphaera galaxeae TaxID=1538023 RepID=UPI0023507A30|nr:redoxin domain-containing protein [Aureisphaera galaxeae]MDC8004939.1 redoxin domain-containing protein [Aureisphaera galaxeae]